MIEMKIGEKYRHHRGFTVEIVDFATFINTESTLVIYTVVERPEEGKYARYLHSFYEPRFVKIEDSNDG